MSGVTNGSTSDKESESEKQTEEMTSPQTAETVVDSSAQGTNSSVDGDGKEAKSIDKDDENYAVFVMNIPLTVSEEDVKKHFEQKVPVKAVSFITASNGKFCGCATVELPDKSAFEGALKLMGSKLETLNLYVVPHWSMSAASDSRSEIKLFKILVSNISKSTTLNEAKKHFYPAGLFRRFVPKASGKNPTKDGIFDTDWSASIKVNKLETFTNILKMDGSILGGQPIKVEAAVADTEGVYKKLAEADPNIVMKQNLLDSDGCEEQEEDECLFKVFVSNVPHTVDGKQMTEHLSQAGEVVSCWIPDEYATRKRPKIASVTMADEESYKKALELSGSKLGENTLKITPFVKGKMNEGRIVADPEWLKKPLVVVLSNIPLKITEVHLKKHFESVGEIVCVRFPKDKALKAAYMELGSEEAYEKAISLSNTFLGEHCISVLPTTSKLVPKHLLDMTAQKMTAKKSTPKNRGKSKNSIKKSRKNAKNKRRLKARNLERERDNMHVPPAKKMKKMKKGSMDLAAYDQYVTSYGSGSGHYNDGWNNDYRSASFKRPTAHLEEAKRKEIKQVALAALTELEARKSGMNNYYSGSSNSYGSSYSYGSNSSYYY